jgi:cephalosporin hydroxylase
MLLPNMINKYIKFTGRVAGWGIRHLRKIKKKGINSIKPWIRTGRIFEKDLYKALQSKDPDRKPMMKFLKEKTVFDLLSFYLCGPHYRFPWAGQLLTKLPMDIPIYSDLITRAKPNLIIEIGTQRGVSALMLADLAKEVGAKVVTIDILPLDDDMFSKFVEKDVSFVQGDATTDQTYQEVIRASGINDEKINALIIDDGSHMKDHVIRSFSLFSSLVRKNGFYVVEDGFSNWMIQKNSHNALGGVDQILENENSFQRCTTYDEFMLASAFLGILQRTL